MTQKGAIGDRVQPCGQAGVASKRGQAREHLEERLLGDIVRERMIARCQPPEELADGRLVPPDQIGECRLVSGEERGNQLAVGPGHYQAAPWPRSSFHTSR